MSETQTVRDILEQTIEANSKVLKEDGNAESFQKVKAAFAEFNDVVLPDLGLQLKFIAAAATLTAAYTGLRMLKEGKFQYNTPQVNGLAPAMVLVDGFDVEGSPVVNDKPFDPAGGYQA